MSPAPTIFWLVSQATWPDTWTALPKGVGAIATCAKPYGRLSKIPAGTWTDRLIAASLSRNRPVDAPHRLQPLIRHLNCMRAVMRRAIGTGPTLAPARQL